MRLLSNWIIHNKPIEIYPAIDCLADHLAFLQPKFVDSEPVVFSELLQSFLRCGERLELQDHPFSRLLFDRKTQTFVKLTASNTRGVLEHL